MSDTPERPKLYITPTAENNDFEHEKHVSVFDYLADAYNAGVMTMEEVELTFLEIEQMNDEVAERDR